MKKSNDSYLIRRRQFLVTGAAALGVAPMAFLPKQAGSANDKIVMGLVGCGGMGMGNINNFLGMRDDVQVVAVNDVDANNLKAAKARVDDRYDNTDCKAYGDYRELLQHPGLNAIVLATPDHMHAQIGVDAANAGMDVYGEKPFAWGLAEGRALVEAVKKNERVWQTGSQQRSGGNFQRFRALIQNNALGKLTRFECGTPGGMSIRDHVPKDKWEEMIGNPPDHLDWEGYCGPVKDYPYHPMVHPWNWRWTNAFGGGQLLDWVGHHVDIGLWSLGLDRTGPVKMEGEGELGNHELFDTYVKYSYKGTYEDGRVIEVRSNFGGTKFTGEKGWIHVDRGRLDASDDELLRDLPEDFETRIPNHHQNFIQCVRSRELPVADAESTHRSSSFGQLGMVAIDSGEALNWDPEKEEVIGNAEQAAHPRLSSRIV